MTLEEVLGRVTNLEDKAFLEKMIKDQNSYITKLETQLKAKPSSENPEAIAGMNKVTYAYLEAKMKEDIITKATAAIKVNIAEPYFVAVEKDWLEFLNKNMDQAHTTVEYATDAFNLVLGRCMANKDHAVNQIGKTQTPNGTPSNQVSAGTNAQGVQDVNNIIRQTPPVMSPNDVNAQSGIPTPQPNQIKNTRNAFDALKTKLGSQRGNPFNN